MLRDKENNRFIALGGANCSRSLRKTALYEFLIVNPEKLDEKPTYREVNGYIRLNIPTFGEEGVSRLSTGIIPVISPCDMISRHKKR
ncbi:MAG: hypothetical protein JKY86_12480 [Gammaproteobacteria bacterium]|nr:hypothetical protein [Gammaproteobacteria bacterium]